VGAGPPLVFAHGLGGCFMSWWQQVAHFARRYACISFSHRGVWPSSAPPEGPDSAAYAADLATLVDELDLGDIRLVCQSMGGWTGVEYALLRPGRVKALVLAATTGTLDPKQMRQPERDQLAAWTAESAALRADLAQRHILPGADAAMAEAQPAPHLLYSQLDALSAGLGKEAVRARLRRREARAATFASWATRERSARVRHGAFCISGYRAGRAKSARQVVPAGRSQRGGRIQGAIPGTRCYSRPTSAAAL
jgi:pimeloyl-ACP methyl ester carboxylesterase